MASLPSLPGSLKPVQHYLKTAIEHDQRDPIVSYYCRLYTAQKAMELDRKSPEARGFIVSLMDLLEKTKQQLAGEEAVQSELVGQAHVEGYALKLFLFADNEDRSARFGKNVVKSFYTAGMLFDVLMQFGELSEDLENNRKYAKWKAAYIHNCLKSGETPVPGPMREEGDEDLGDMSGLGLDHPGPSTSPYQQPLPPIPPAANQGGYPPASGGGYPPSNLQPGGYNQAPGGYSQQPTMPSPQAHAPPTTPSDPSAGTRWQPPPNAGGVKLESADYQKAMKLCKYASSALQYEDSKTAVDNLTKALNLLTTGKE